MNLSEGVSDLSRELCSSVFREPLLCPDTGVYIRQAHIGDLSHMKDLYANAFDRGDWYGSRTAARDGAGASTEYLQHYLQEQQAIVVLFHDLNHNVLGSTLLDLSSEDGVLIDDTQVHPALGRRKGIMSAYFRRLVPELNRIGCPYWTEFVLTPESKVLRRVLITELGMCVTGIRPAAYLIHPTNERRSVVVAHGPGPWVTSWLSSIAKTQGNLTDLISCLTRPEFTQSRENGQMHALTRDFQDYEEDEFDLNNEQGIADAISRGGVPVGLRPLTNQVYISRWPRMDLSTLDFLYEEGIAPISNLLTYLKRIAPGNGV